MLGGWYRPSLHFMGRSRSTLGSVPPPWCRAHAGGGGQPDGAVYWAGPPVGGGPHHGPPEAAVRGQLSTPAAQTHSSWPSGPAAAAERVGGALQHEWPGTAAAMTGHGLKLLRCWGDHRMGVEIARLSAGEAARWRWQAGCQLLCLRGAQHPAHACYFIARTRASLVASCGAVRHQSGCLITDENSGKRGRGKCNGAREQASAGARGVAGIANIFVQTGEPCCGERACKAPETELLMQP
jgi:hypothetical protein